MNESRQIQDPEAADATESVGGGQGGKWGGGLKISAWEQLHPSGSYSHRWDIYLEKLNQRGSGLWILDIARLEGKLGTEIRMKVPCSLLTIQFPDLYLLIGDWKVLCWRNIMAKEKRPIDAALWESSNKKLGGQSTRQWSWPVYMPCLLTYSSQAALLCFIHSTIRTLTGYQSFEESF